MMVYWKGRDWFGNPVVIKQIKKDEMIVLCDGDCVDVIFIPPDEIPEETLAWYIKTRELQK